MGSSGRRSLLALHRYEQHHPTPIFNGIKPPYSILAYCAAIALQPRALRLIACAVRPADG